MQRIILENVSKVIRNVEVLNDINLSFEKGKIYGLKGYNGSGKTMLLRMIAGIIQPTEGTVSVDDEILHKDIDFPKDMGVLIENPNFWNNYTAKEVLYSLAVINKKIGISQVPLNRLMELFLVAVIGGILMEAAFGKCLIRRLSDGKRICLFLVPFAGITFVCAALFGWITEFDMLDTYVRFIGIFLVCGDISGTLSIQNFYFGL